MSSMDTFLRDKSFSATTNTVLFTARWKRKGLGRNRKKSDPSVPQPRASLGELTAIKGSVADMEGLDGVAMVEQQTPQPSRRNMQKLTSIRSLHMDDDEMAAIVAQQEEEEKEEERREAEAEAASMPTDGTDEKAAEEPPKA